MEGRARTVGIGHQDFETVRKLKCRRMGKGSCFRQQEHSDFSGCKHRVRQCYVAAGGFRDSIVRFRFKQDDAGKMPGKSAGAEAGRGLAMLRFQGSRQQV